MELDGDALALAVRLVLAVVLGFAAVAKACGRDRAIEAARALGVPGRWAAPVTWTVIAAEGVIALSLIPATTATAAAIAAATLFAGFSAVLAVNLGRGRRPACNCFGVRSAKPISGWSLGRNAVLAAAAISVVVRGPGPALPTSVSSLHGPTALLVLVLGALTATVAGQGWLLLRLLARYGQLLVRVDELSGPAVEGEPDHGGVAIGKPAPEFSLAGVHGETMTLSALRSVGRPVLLLFSDPGCGPCTALAPSVARWQRSHHDRVRLVVVSAGDSAVVRSKAAEHGIVDVFVQSAREVSAAYQVDGTPSAVLVDAAGRIASHVAVGGPAIEALVRRIAGDVPVALGRSDRHVHHHDQHGRTPHELVVGTEAPAFRLPTVGGGDAALEEFRGRPVVVLFWDPRCGFCTALAPAILDWERGRPPTAPELLIVSTGDEAANADTGFSSTVLLDATRSTMARYGASGTPMAVLVDGDGRVASPVRIGAPGLRELLGISIEEVHP